MTSVQSPLKMNPNGYTTLLGFYPDLNMFAGFDLTRHRTFTTGSPSVQVDIHTIHEALQNGLAFSTKDNQEIAVGIRPDQLIHYILNAQLLHEYGVDATTLNLLKKATLSEIIDQDIVDLTTERQKIVSQMSRYSRDANFRKKVLNAYDNRCAITRSQLKLVDAAHILPVASDDSSDHVSNGVALSPTMHRAYDTGLIFLDESYYIRLNKDKADELKGQNLHGGMKQFRSLLEQQIHLPMDTINALIKSSSAWQIITAVFLVIFRFLQYHRKQTVFSVPRFPNVSKHRQTGYWRENQRKIQKRIAMSLKQRETKPRLLNEKSTSRRMTNPFKTCVVRHLQQYWSL